VALLLFNLYSKESLLLEKEPEKMNESLSFNCAKTDLEFGFNLSNKEVGFVQATTIGKTLSQQNKRKHLVLNLKNIKLECNIFENLPHFVVYRLEIMKAY